MPAQVTILDTGTGNLHSVQRRLDRLGARTLVTSEPDAVQRAEKLVLPGVGHFQRAMENLVRLDLVDALQEVAGVRRIPILGICLGMHLMARRGEEGGAEGLGWVDADVVRFAVGDTLRHKVPHMGWNTVSLLKDSVLTKGVKPDAEFYFVHSYHLAPRDRRIVLGETEYAYPFPSAIESGNLFGVQFHPEKSHEAGDLLLKNFVAI